jgi:nitrogen regulatory protein PII
MKGRLAISRLSRTGAATMASHTLTPMKKVEIVVDGEQVQAVKDALSEASVSGYTILGNVSGMGHHGRHEGRLLFDDVGTQVMFVTVVPEEALAGLLDGLLPLFAVKSGVAFVSDVAVSRATYFRGS